MSQEAPHLKANFEAEGWFRKHISKEHKINRIAYWVANRQLDSRKKTCILSSALKLQKNELLQLTRQICKTPRNERPGIDRKLIKFVISQLKLDFENRELINMVPKLVEYRCCPKESFVAKEGEPFWGLFLLLEGTCEIMTSRTTMVVEGEAVFGEKALLLGDPSNVSIKCKSICEFLVLNKPDFLSQVHKAQCLSSKSVEGVLGKVPLFKDFSSREIKRMAEQAQVVRLGGKGELISEGVPHQYLYVVVTGQMALVEQQNGKEKLLLSFDKLEVLNAEAIIGKTPIFSTKCLSDNAQLLRIPTSILTQMTPQHPKTFKESVRARMDFEKTLSTYKRFPPSPRKKIAATQESSTFFSDTLQAEEPRRAIKAVKSEFLPVKTSILSNLRSMSKSQRGGSGSIRSKKSGPIEISSLCRHLESDQRTPNHFMLQAFKNKIESSYSIKLDVQNKLGERHSSSHLRKYQIDVTPQSHRIDLSQRTRRPLTHHTNKSQTLPSRLKTCDSRFQDTQMLLRRVQMSSCRKRRNRTKVMFDPQEIMDFSEHLRE